MTALRTRQERRDELIDSLALLDMARLHYVLATASSIGDLDIERALAQVERSHGEVAGAYAAWARHQRGLNRSTVARLIGLLAQPPLLPLDSLGGTNDH